MRRLPGSLPAASIIVAAANNILPVVTESRARIAFGFGLLHGFGFASVLADMGLPLAGFPNGRRPYDDVVDITLRVAEGALCGAIGTCGAETADPNHAAPYNDGVRAAGPDLADAHVTGQIDAADTYLATFPYLYSPIPGSPQGALAAAQ